MRNKRIPSLLIAAFFILGVLVLGQHFTPSVPSQKIFPSSPTPSVSVSTPTQAVNNLSSARIIKVIDGDTLQVFVNGQKETIRLIGMDTPETVDPRKPIQCFGKEASDKAKEILTGKTIFLELDSTQGDKDKYNRLLRYVFLEDGTSFNKMMIAEGYAHEYTYAAPYKYQAEYKQAEVEARNNDLGLWSPSACSQTLVSLSPTKAVNTVPTAAVENGKYACDCSKLCSQIKTCDEAYYQLNNCGCTARDADSDGIPCESLCK